jgi:RimJ/RimL family protein N-acetyltransferase
MSTPLPLPASWSLAPDLGDALVRLEPLGPEHVADLDEVVADGVLGRLWYTSTPGPGGSGAYVADAMAEREAGRMAPFAVRAVGTGRVVGTTRFYDLAPEVPRIAIGYTWYAPAVQRTHVNAACKRLLLAHAFETLGCATVEFHTDRHNRPSRQALERLGAREDGILRSHQLRPDGTRRDTVCFSILASEWDDVRRGLDLRIERSTGRPATPA